MLKNLLANLLFAFLCICRCISLAVWPYDAVTDCL